MVRFLALSPRARIYYQGLEAKRGNPRAHMRKILALAQIHGRDALVRALDDGIELQAFSCEYIANILDARSRIQPEPAPLQLTRRQDLLDLEIPIRTCPSTTEATMRTKRTETPPAADADPLAQRLGADASLPFMLEHYRPLAQTAADKNWSHIDYLSELINGECGLA